MMHLLLAQALAQDTVSIRGDVRYSGVGPVVVEVLLIESSGPPLLAGSAVVESGNGPFEVQVRARIGTVSVRAAHDPDRDGVSETDAQTIWPEPLAVNSADIEGLQLHLEQSLEPRPGTPASP